MIDLMNKANHKNIKFKLLLISVISFLIILGYLPIILKNKVSNQPMQQGQLRNNISYFANHDITDIVSYGINHVYNNMTDVSNRDYEFIMPLESNVYINNNKYTRLAKKSLHGYLINQLPQFKNAALDYNQANIKTTKINNTHQKSNFTLNYNLTTNIVHLKNATINKWFYSPIDNYQRQQATRIATLNSPNALRNYVINHNQLENSALNKKWITTSNQNSKIYTNDFDDEDAPEPHTSKLTNNKVNKIISNKGFNTKKNKYQFKGSINALAFINMLTNQLNYQNQNLDYKYKYLSNKFNGYVFYKKYLLQAFIPDNNEDLNKTLGEVYFGPNDLGKMNQMSDHLPLYIPAITEFGQDNLDQAKLENIYTTYKKYSHLNNSQIDTLYNQIHQSTQYYQQNNHINYNSIEYLTNVDLVNRISFCNSILQSNKTNKHLAKNKLNFLHPETDKSFWKLFNRYIYAYKNKCIRYQKRVNKTKQPIIIQNYGSITYNPTNNTVIKSSIVSKAINNQKLISYTKYSFKNKASEKLTKIPKGQKNSYVLYKKEKKLVEKQQAFDQIKKLALKHPKKFKKLMAPDQTVINGVAKDFTPKQLVQKTKEYLEN